MRPLARAAEFTISVTIRETGVDEGGWVTVAAEEGVWYIASEGRRFETRVDPCDAIYAWLGRFRAEPGWGPTEVERIALAERLGLVELAGAV